MKFMTSNVLICLVLYLVLPLVHWFTDFNAPISSGLLLYGCLLFFTMNLVTV